MESKCEVPIYLIYGDLIKKILPNWFVCPDNLCKFNECLRLGHLHVNVFLIS